MTEITDAKLKNLLEKAEAAQRAFEEGERKLYREDREKLYGDTEHADRMRELRAERKRVCREVQREAREIGQAAAQEIERMENADPLASLTTEELATANARRAFALDTAEVLGPGDLAKRLESMLDSGDRGEIGACLSAGEKARARIIERRRSREGSGAAQGQARLSTSTVLDDVLGRMRGALVGDQSAKIEAARTRQQEAVTVETLAGRLQTGARSAAEARRQRIAGVA